MCSSDLLSGRLKDGDSALVDVNDDKQVVIRQATLPPQPELAGSSA